MTLPVNSARLNHYRNSEDTQVGDVIQVLQNDGKGNFTTNDSIVLNRRDIASAAFGDVNKDGIPDLVSGEWGWKTPPRSAGS